VIRNSHRENGDYRRRSSVRANHVGASTHPTDPFVSPAVHLRNAFSGIAGNYFTIHIHGFATKITKSFLRDNTNEPTLLIYPR
jgi:hypothetical protein